ncbi:MAG: 16S rRNA (cytosine(967)-C(5))-methyltransferase RsmB [Acidobacteria bacterium]|nr:16S rRNA (cytosine(967)-C(5))-methyltransferase RsmB [Acidobacteriota bacterium]MYD69739.1 16S rRNA (cytosine(967)-C(5))-methyltransferase RsmB [Acidobacteriota bacterium]
MTRQVAPARVAAHQVLRAVHLRRDLATALAAARRELNDPRDRALAGEIACGTLRWRNAIDHFLTQVSTRPLARISPPILDLLRAATYQIHWLDRIPPHAVVADAVTLSRVIGKPRGAGFVNAVLRALADTRRAPALSLPDAPAHDTRPENAENPLISREPALDYLGVTLSHPRWLVARWLDRHGFDAAVDWTRFNNGVPPVTLRPNLARISASGLATALAAYDVRTTPARHAPHGLHVQVGDPASTPLAAEGLFVIQDEASQLILELVTLPAGGTILDLCASPGNKTAGLAAPRLEVSAPSARRQDDGVALVVACDHRPHRVSLLKRARERLGLSNVAVVRLDATAPLPFGERFDHVLLDAPCSGLGIVRRDPDIKWRREPRDLHVFADRQLAMLRRAAACVRRGGRLVYSTCSSEPEENEEVVAQFLEDRTAFTLIQPESPVARPFVDNAGYFRTLPFRDGVDAFFGAVLRRKAA